jgi:hypothetical protein
LPIGRLPASGATDAANKLLRSRSHERERVEGAEFGSERSTRSRS